MAVAMPRLVFVTDSMPLRGPAAAVGYVLATARANGMRINRTKLAKLLYLADLRAVEQGIPPGSGMEWRWRHYGPHSRRLAEVERGLREAGVLEVEESVDPFAGYRECAIYLVDAPQTIIDEQYMRIIEGVLADFGQWSAGQLRDLTYQTPPMLAAVQHGQREVRLDLAGGPPLPDLESGLAHLRQWAERHPLPDDEPGGIEDLVGEYQHLAENRAEATRRLLEE